MKWVQLSRRDDLRNKSTEYLYANCRLCEKHFEDSQFYYAPTKTRLLPYAVPTLFDVPDPPPLICSRNRTLRKRSAPQATLANVKRQKKNRGNIFAFLPCKTKLVYMIWIKVTSSFLKTFRYIFAVDTYI